jgi:hypothetical protein
MEASDQLHALAALIPLLPGMEMRYALNTESNILAPRQDQTTVFLLN